MPRRTSGAPARAATRAPARGSRLTARNAIVVRRRPRVAQLDQTPDAGPCGGGSTSSRKSWMRTRAASPTADSILACTSGFSTPFGRAQLLRFGAKSEFTETAQQLDRMEEVTVQTIAPHGDLIEGAAGPPAALEVGLRRLERASLLPGCRERVRPWPRCTGCKLKVPSSESIKCRTQPNRKPWVT